MPDQRIIFSYDMHLDQARISVSLATVELKPAGDGTQLVFTEQAVFLDGDDDAGSRERGTRGLLDQLDADLRREAASAELTSAGVTIIAVALAAVRCGDRESIAPR